MLKAISTALLATVTLVGCAGMSYEARCAAPLEKAPSATAIESGTKLVRENYVYTERLYYSANEWVFFADNSGRDINATKGPAAILKGTGNILKSAVLPMTSFELFNGEWNISQTNPKCYSLTKDGDIAKGYLATTNQFPYAMKDESESLWKVDYFDLYHPSRLQKDGPLTLTHADASLNVTIAAKGDDFTVNDVAARLVPSKQPFASSMLTVEQSNETYLIIGMKRSSNGGLYYVLKNNEQLLIMNGPNR